jgi:regulator of protease activity HflC (stomatin/prohibitin superfamily)
MKKTTNRDYPLSTTPTAMPYGGSDSIPTIQAIVGAARANRAENIDAKAEKVKARKEGKAAIIKARGEAKAEKIRARAEAYKIKH